MLKTLIVVINLAFCYGNVIADIKITKLPAQKNASLNLIYEMIQDSRGFIWFGTMFGLVRFDGREYVNFRYNPNDINSISGDDVVSILEDSKGNIWTGSFKGGINKYDISKNQFIRISQDTPYNNFTFWSICEINNKLFFGSDRGLFIYENNELKKVEQQPFSTFPVSSMSTDGKNLWIGSMQKGIIITDPDFTKYQKFNYDSTILSSINYVSVSALNYSNGKMYAGFTQNGMGYFEISGNDSIVFKKLQNLDSANISKSGITTITSDGKDRMFIGTSSGGYIYNTRSGKVLNINERIKEENTNKNFNKALFDVSGVLWLGSYFDGLYKVTDELVNFYRLPHSKFVNNRCIFEDSENKLWISSNRSLYIYSGDIVIFDSLKLKPLINKIVNSIVMFKNKIWAGCASGIVTFDIEGNIIDKEIKIRNKLPFINRFFVANENEMYIATNIGLYKTDGIEFNEIFLDSGISPFDKSVISVFTDSMGSLYAGTFNGIFISGDGKNFIKYSKSSGKNSSLSNNYVYSFCPLDDNKILLGTAAGLNIYNKKNKTIEIINNYALMDKVILSIVKVGNYFWCNTNSGISKYDYKNNNLIQYNKTNGLNDDYYFPNSAIYTGSGVYMGGSQTEISYFRPKMINESNYIPNIIFSGLKITSEDTTYTKNFQSEKLVLEHNENDIEITFSSTDFSKPENIEYMYRINESVWENTGNINKIFFTNLSSGEYVIEIKGTNSDGIWNDKIFTKKLIIKPPFYKTNLFYLSVLMIVLFAGYILFKFKTERKIKHILELEKARENEREMFRKQAAKDYHDELGHKLTRILLYTRNINKKINSGNESEVASELKNIEETSLSLKNSARDLIWSINPVEDSVYDLALRVKDFAEEILEPADIKFHLNMESNDLKFIDLPVIVKRNLVFIFKEAINNAVKYSNCKNIYFKPEIIKSEAIFTISDDGRGFNSEIEYSGYGLKNMKERALSINSQLTISSEVNKGTFIKLIYNISSEKLIYNLN